jgi:hypothetical protein
VTDLQRAVWAATFSLHFREAVTGIPASVNAVPLDREQYLEHAASLAAVRAYEAARHAPGEV